MSVHLTEEEQLETLKRWWKEHGKTIVFVILFSVAGYFSWTSWQDQQQRKAEDASVVYDDLLSLVEDAAGEPLSDNARATAAHLVAELKQKNRKSQYALNGAFLLSRFEVEAGNLEEAASELRWIIDQRPSTAVDQLARTRLARVLLAQGEYDAALAQLNPPINDNFSAEFAEIRGDVLLARGDVSGARNAYQSALSALTSQQQQRGMLLQMKLDDLRAAPVSQQADAEGNAS